MPTQMHLAHLSDSANETHFNLRFSESGSLYSMTCSNSVDLPLSNLEVCNMHATYLIRRSAVGTHLNVAANTLRTN